MGGVEVRDQACERCPRCGRYWLQVQRSSVQAGLLHCLHERVGRIRQGSSTAWISRVLSQVKVFIALDRNRDQRIGYLIFTKRLYSSSNTSINRSSRGGSIRLGNLIVQVGKCHVDVLTTCRDLIF